MFDALRIEIKLYFSSQGDGDDSESLRGCGLANNSHDDLQTIPGCNNILYPPPLAGNKLTTPVNIFDHPSRCGDVFLPSTP